LMPGLPKGKEERLKFEINRNRTIIIWDRHQ